MRRTIAGLLCFFVLTASAGTAAANHVAGAEGAMGAGALWWRHNANHGTIYFLDVYESVSTYQNRAPVDRAFFGSIPCEVNRRGRPHECSWRKGEFRRVKVDSFEIDPLMNSAHVVVHSGDRRGEVTWTGRGDYSEPFLWQSVGEFVAPPHFAHVYANVMTAVGRDAIARGDVFGLDLKRSEFQNAGMIDIVYLNAGACLMGPWC